MNELVEVTIPMLRDDAEFLVSAVRRGRGEVYISTPAERWLSLAASFVAGGLFAALLMLAWR